jgi:hypothetical protein
MNGEMTTGAMRLLGGSRGNSSTNTPTLAQPPSDKEKIILTVASQSNLTINGDLELQAGTPDASSTRSRFQETHSAAPVMQARPDGPTTRIGLVAVS